MNAARSGPWIMQQRWHDLLFAHWPVPAAAIQQLLPPGLEVQTYGERAWLSVIPFHMSGVRFRAMPPVPTASKFAELNVRSYVTYQGKPGIWFFSLDAASTLAVLGARVGARLPYYRATMACQLGSRAIDYRSERWKNGGAGASFDATYHPTIPCPSLPGSLDHFLTERYSLFSSDGRRIWRVDIQHAPWELYVASATIRTNTMAAAAGVSVNGEKPLLHFATVQDVRFWRPVRVQ